MTDDPLDSPAARAWRLTRRETEAPEGFAGRVLAAGCPTRGAGPTSRAWWRWVALTAGGVWFVARLAGLFLVFSAS